MFVHEIAHVNYLNVFCFIMVRAPVAQRAVQALVVVVSLDIFEDFSTSCNLGGEDLIAGKALPLERTEEGFGLGIIITISYPAHAEIGPNNAQRFAYGLAAVLVASRRPSMPSTVPSSHHQSVFKGGYYQLCLQRFAECDSCVDDGGGVTGQGHLKPAFYRRHVGDI